MNQVKTSTYANIAEYAVMFGMTFDEAYSFAQQGNYMSMLRDIRRGGV